MPKQQESPDRPVWPDELGPDETGDCLEHVRRERDTLRRQVARLRKEVARLAVVSLGK